MILERKSAHVVSCEEHTHYYKLGGDLGFLSSALLPALNNTKLYSYEMEGLEGEIDCHLSNCIGTFVRSASEMLDEFLDRWVRSVLEVSWGPVPLYHVLRATLTGTPRQAWSLNEF